MKKDWSKHWKSSVQGRKQRKYVHNAPLHIRHKFMSARLSEGLEKEYNTRNLPVRKGDTVKIMRGSFKNFSGKIAQVSLARMRVYVEGATTTRSDATKAMYPIHPSNLLLTKLDTSDKKRMEKVAEIKEVNKKNGNK